MLILAQSIGITHAYCMKIPISISSLWSICSLKNVAVAINPFKYVPSMQMCWHFAGVGLKEGIVLNDIGTPWGGRQTVRGSEQVICSALLHVKWDTVTHSYNFCPSSQPRFLFSPEAKLYKGSEQRASGVSCGGPSSASLKSLFSALLRHPSRSLLFHTFFCVLCFTNTRCPSLSRFF